MTQMTQPEHAHVHIYKHPQTQSQPLLGSLSLPRIITFYLTLILIGPLYSYHMSVAQHQQPPFPHTTITNTACHYPQATVFRWLMLYSASFLTLIYHVIFRWYRLEATRFGYPGGGYSYMYWPTMLSVLGYVAAIGTIDTGGTGTLHMVGAIYFFAILYFMVINFTIIAKNIRQWDCRFMTRKSLMSKIIVSGYFNCVWIYCFYGLAVNPSTGVAEDNKYFVIMEWNLVYTGLVWILCFLGDFWNVKIILVKDKNQLDKNNSRQEIEEIVQNSS